MQKHVASSLGKTFNFPCFVYHIEASSVWQVIRVLFGNADYRFNDDGKLTTFAPGMTDMG